MSADSSASGAGTCTLYGELASWCPLLSPPEDCAEEASFYPDTLLEACEIPPRTLLALGYILRDRDGSTRVLHDQHTEGLFARAEWLRILSDAGFLPQILQFDHSELEPGSYHVVVGRKPRGPVGA
jgi:hypothetical protein